MEKSYPDEYFDCFYIWLLFCCCQSCIGVDEMAQKHGLVVERTQVDVDGDNVPDLEVAQHADGTLEIKAVGSGKCECFMDSDIDP